MPRKRTPKYMLHRPTGQARVRLDGRDNYLGPHGSRESRERYDELVSEWLASNDDQTRFALTIDELSILFLEHAKTYYLKDGKPTSEVSNIRTALRPMVKLFGSTRVRDFGPRKLKLVRQAMIEAGCVRTSINRQVSRIRMMFKWGVENEYLPVDVHTTLATVSGLRAGRSKAVESEPVKPVPDSFVNAVEPHVPRQVWCMIQLQLLSGARPGEVASMRGCDLITTGETWEYRPSRHKTQHRGKTRVVFLGPKAQSIIHQFLKTDMQEFLFSPRDVVNELNARKRANRKSPMTPSQSNRCQKAKPKRRPGERYTKDSYRIVIQRACKKADVPKWHPNQLRHNAGTELRRRYGIEAARTVLGHTSAATTEIYAELDMEKAKRIIGEVG